MDQLCSASLNVGHDFEHFWELLNIGGLFSIIVRAEQINALNNKL